MLEKIFFTAFIFLAGFRCAVAQTDSTDLSLYRTEVIIESEVDSILFDSGLYEKLNLDFEISDTLSFKKVFIDLKDKTTEELIFRKSWTLAELVALGLSESWNVTIPFGNFLNTQIYCVSIIIEDYSGALSSTITKTLNP